MKKDLTDPMHLAIATGALILHGELTDSIEADGLETTVYVPMQLPGNTWKAFSNMFALDHKLASVVVTSIFVAGLDSVIDTFDLRNKRSYDEFKAALLKQAKESNIELH